MNNEIAIFPGAEMSEYAKWKAGLYFDPGDPKICAERDHAKRLLAAVRRAEDQLDSASVEQAQRALFGFMGEGVIVNPGLRCDFGSNIKLGARSFLNFNCVLLDVGPIEIGDNTLVGPDVHFYAVNHPIMPSERRLRRNCKAESVIVGKDCWIGGGARISAGVRIGDGVLVAAGSVVTMKCVEPYTIVAGNPGKILRRIYDTADMLSMLERLDAGEGIESLAG